MFSKIFYVSFLLAFFVLGTNCSPFLPYYPYNDNYNNLSGQAGQGNGGAQGEITSRGGPSINVNPVNNAESHSGSSPYNSQTAGHTQYPY